MKVWLDDQIDDPSAPARHPPEGWVGVRSAVEACRLLRRQAVTHISLDHDLSEGKPTGYLVARFIESQAYRGRLRPLEWSIHSANPVGAARMVLALQGASRFWEEPRNLPL